MTENDNKYKYLRKIIKHYFQEQCMNNAINTNVKLINKYRIITRAYDKEIIYIKCIKSYDSIVETIVIRVEQNANYK